MARGNPNLQPGPGRPLGSPNKATVKAKAAIAGLLEGNAEKLNQWADEVYKSKGAEAALDIYLKFTEYHIPKLARHVLEGDPDKPIHLNATVNFISKKGESNGMS